MQKILEQYKIFEEKIKTEISDSNNDRLPIYDGAVNIEKYLKAKYKVAWLLKEAYCEKDGTGGDWHYSEILDVDNLYDSLIQPNASRATWAPIVYASYGILKGYRYYDDMDFIKDDPSMAQVVREIAIVNAQKLPARQHTVTDIKDIQEAITKHGNLIMEQLELLNPDILIGGATMKLYKQLFALKDDEMKTVGCVNYWIKDEKLYIDAYHPAQRQLSHEVYVDSILAAVDVFTNRKN